MMLFLEICFKNLVYFFTNSNHRQFYILALLHGDSKRYKVQEVKIHGKKWKVADCLSFIYQFKEIYVDQSYLFKCTSTSPIIIDCGSNIGLSALYFSEHYPNAQITCIEADASIAEILKENLQKNNIKAEVIAKAAWIHDEGVSFQSEGSDSGSVQEGAGTKIPSLRLSEFIKKWPKIDLLKIDIEGAEKQVLKDCAHSLNSVQNLFIEYHGSYNESQALDELLGILRTANFHYFIKTENRRKSPFVNQHENKMYDLQLNIYAYRKA